LAVKLAIKISTSESHGLQCCLSHIVGFSPFCPASVYWYIPLAEWADSLEASNARALQLLMADACLTGITLRLSNIGISLDALGTGFERSLAGDYTPVGQRAGFSK
jgi:hypothetical protein